MVKRVISSSSHLQPRDGIPLFAAVPASLHHEQESDMPRRFHLIAVSAAFTPSGPALARGDLRHVAGGNRESRRAARL
jgi:hypothetical protein